MAVNICSSGLWHAFHIQDAKARNKATSLPILSILLAHINASSPELFLNMSNKSPSYRTIGFVITYSPLYSSIYF